MTRRRTPPTDAAPSDETPPSRAPRVGLVNLGCPKNTIDGEAALAELLEAGWELSTAPEEADLVLVNTCAFIASAREESFAELEALLAARDEEGYPRVVALGCLAKRLREAIYERIPEVDALFGFDAYGRLPKLCLAVLRGEEVTSWSRGLAARRGPEGEGTVVVEGARLLTTPPSYAYLRLAEGCDNRCAYCSIPAIRGALRSRSSANILEEALALTGEGGVRELVLVAQDTTAYGVDRYGEGRLAPLVEELLEKTEARRIRILYAHPRHLDPATIALLGAEERLCGYLDMPIQHIDDDVLAAMGRGYDGRRVRDLVASLRGARGGMVLRTGLIAGFPAEEEAAFGRLLAFVEEGHFQHLGAFAYSPEEGTAAAATRGGPSATEAAARRDALLEAQQGVARAWREGRMGREETVLVDTVEEGVALGRSVAEAPEIDGGIRVRAIDAKTRAGDEIRACLQSCDPYDIEAVYVPS